MFENYYLKEKSMVIAGEAVTLKKLNAADRAILGPVVGAILSAAQETLKSGNPGRAEPFKLNTFDMDKAIDETSRWTETVVYMLHRSIGGMTTEEATALVANCEPGILDQLIVEIIKFNYLELDDPAQKPSKKKSSIR